MGIDIEIGDKKETQKDVENTKENNTEVPQSPVLEEKESLEEVAIEKIARRQGWVPLDEYEGPKNNWRNAKDFVEKGKQIKESQATELRELRQTVVFQTQMLREILEEQARTKQSALGKMKAEALSSNNHELAANLEKDIQTTKEKIAKFDNTPDMQVIDGWNKKNSNWLNDNTPENRKMTIRVRRYAEEYEADNPGAAVGEILQYAEDKIKEDFPHRFGEKPMTSSRTESLNRANPLGPKTKREYTLDDLEPAFRNTVRDMCRRSGLSVDTYIKQLKATGAIK